MKMTEEMSTNDKNYFNKPEAQKEKKKISEKIIDLSPFISKHYTMLHKEAAKIENCLFCNEFLNPFVNTLVLKKVKSEMINKKNVDSILLEGFVTFSMILN